MRMRCEPSLASVAALTAIAALALFSLPCWSQAPTPTTSAAPPMPHTSLSQNRVLQEPATQGSRRTQSPASQVPAPLGAPQAPHLAASGSNSAIQNHPRIQSSQALASAAKQQVREIQSNYFPIVYGSLTGVEAGIPGQPHQPQALSTIPSSTIVTRTASP